MSGNRAGDSDDHGEMPPDPFGPGDPPGLDDESGHAEPVAPGRPAASQPGGSGDPMAMLGAMFGPGVQGMMSQLGAMFGGGLPWDMTRQIAAWSASGGATEPNVDPVDRIRLEELLRIALPHVEELAEVPVAGAGGLALDAVTRAGWAGDLLDRQRPLLERLAGSLGSAPAAPPGPDAPGAIPDPLSGLLRMLGPSLVAMQVGGMIGQLATRALSGYELPLPRTGPALERIVVVAAGVDEMAETWGLARDDVRLRVILGELAHTAVMRSPSVGAALADALARHASGFRLDPDAIGTLLADVDPTDPASIQAALSAPHRMLGAMTTPEQTAARADLDRLLAVLVGWVDHVVGQCAIRLLGSDRVGEALRRRRLEPSASDPMLDQLLGIRRDRAIVDRGAAFVRGIVERDPDRLPDLLRRAAAVPTAAELDAPGLWLARLELG